MIGDSSEQKTSERRVLIVESDIRELELCKSSILKQSKLYEVQTASNGAEAFNQIAKLKFDVVVLNYELPDINGGDFIKKLHERIPNCPLIVLTKVNKYKTEIV